MAEPRPCEGIRAFGVCHVCTIGTPVADMLAHSPPLIIDYITEDDDITALDDSEDGIVGTRAHEARGSMPTRRFAICNTFTIDAVIPSCQPQINPSVFQRALVVPYFSTVS